MSIGDGVIPLRLEVDSAMGITLLNSEERIVITDIFQAGDSLSLTMPRYESRFVGTILSDTVSLSDLRYIWLVMFILGD